MEIVAIFDSDHPKMGASLYDGDEEDIFSQLLEQWYDRSYLTGFFLDNKADLQAHWPGLTIAQAVSYVIEEVKTFEKELLAIQNEDAGYENFDMKKLFEQYHEQEFSVRKKGENFRKARPDLSDPMLRLYAIELQDGYVITGVCIKLTKQLNQQTKDIIEPQLNKSQDYINANQIVSLSDL